MLRYNLDHGSEDSLEFHSLLNNTKHITVFSTEAISKVIQYKWRIVRILGYAEFVLTIILMISLYFHSSDFT